MIIASWNVNSVKARLTHLQRWLESTPVDVLLLQELKGEASGFPADALRDLGFAHQTIVGQKSYNGVAFLSRHEVTDIITRLPGDDADEQARFVGGTVNGVRICNLYAPNGNPIGEPKFVYKLAWLDRLHGYARDLFATQQPVVFTGDFNIIPTARDAKTPSAWINDALYQPQSRDAYARMLNIGYADALRIYHPDSEIYTFFDYRNGAWQNNDGIRIDHYLLSPEAVDKTQNAWVDTTPRGWETPSDHVPILLQIA